MLPLLMPFGVRASKRAGPSAGFGAVLDDILPEDRFDDQPLLGDDGRYLLAADVRIDNRDELAGLLNVSRRTLAQTSDSALLLKAWQQWQLGCLDRLLGDAAFAVWDSISKRLTLARTASSLRPLFYHRGATFAAFASSPQALLALPELERRPNFREAAAIVAGIPGRGNATIFEGIRMVRHAYAVEVTADGERELRHWFPENVERRPIALADAAAAMRSELDRAVTAQLRRSSGRTATQLSSGRDSTAVTAAAALAMRQDENLLALTGSPNERFAGPYVPGRLADESELASLFAAGYDNVEHVICRSSRRDLDAEFSALATHYFRPLTNPTALHWAAEIEEEAKRRGARVMLIGSAGNFSISASGPKHLIDVLRNAGLVNWARQIRRLRSRSLATWRNIASISLGPFLPAALYEKLLVATGRNPRAGIDLPVLRQPYRAQAEEAMQAEFGDFRPSRDYQQFRCEMLLGRDNADKSSFPLTGLDIRDPTADRRLVELCLSFPAEHLISAQFEPSPVYLAAFRDRIPGDLMRNRLRGIQGADWFMLFTRADIERCFADYRRSPIVAELFDFAEIDRLIGEWPADGSAEWPVVSLFRFQLVPALAVAAFLAKQFPG